MTDRAAVAAPRELLVEQARLHTLVVLVLAAVVRVVIAFEGVVVDLADLNAGVDADGLHAEDLQRPEAAEPHIAKAGGHVDKEPQPPDRRAALEHRHAALGAGKLDGAAQVEPARLEHETCCRKLDLGKAVRPRHVEDILLIAQETVVEPEVVAVGVQLPLVERLNVNRTPEPALDFLA